MPGVPMSPSPASLQLRHSYARRPYARYFVPDVPMPGLLVAEAFLCPHPYARYFVPDVSMPGLLVAEAFLCPASLCPAPPPKPCSRGIPMPGIPMPGPFPKLCRGWPEMP